MKESEKLTFEYSVSLSYFGTVAETLAAIEHIIDKCPEGVSEVSLEEMAHGKCLIRDVLTKLDTIIKKTTEENSS